jgi:hypothetical protein
MHIAGACGSELRSQLRSTAGLEHGGCQLEDLARTIGRISVVFGRSVRPSRLPAQHGLPSARRGSCAARRRLSILTSTEQSLNNSPPTPCITRFSSELPGREPPSPTTRVTLLTGGLLVRVQPEEPLLQGPFRSDRWQFIPSGGVTVSGQAHVLRRIDATITRPQAPSDTLHRPDGPRPRSGLPAPWRRSAAADRSQLSGRPGRDFQRQNSRQPWRCHRISVSGLTTVRSARQSRNWERRTSAMRVDASARRGFVRRS